MSSTRPQIKSLYDEMVKTLSQRYPDTAERDARYILQTRAGIDWTSLVSNPSQTVLPTVLALIQEDLAAVLSGRPLSRIYGVREFYGLEFELNADTLDPRPDTEVLVDLALKRLEGIEKPRILDLGTGSGCILVSILERVKDARGVGIDLSFAAILSARANAQRHKVADRAQFICGNWAESLDATFDLVVSNPPYIENHVVQTLDELVKNYDPILALAGGKDGMQAYREIFLHIERLVKTGGTALFEIGFDQEDSIARLSKESRFLLREVHRDLGGQPRVAEITFS